MLGLHRRVDLLGMIVGGLSATASGAGLGGDGAVRSTQASGGIGDPRSHGYLDHGGWAVLGASGKQPHTGGPPSRVVKGEPTAAPQLSSRVHYHVQWDLGRSRIRTFAIPDLPRA